MPLEEKNAVLRAVSCVSEGCLLTEDAQFPLSKLTGPPGTCDVGQGCPSQLLWRGRKQLRER